MKKKPRHTRQALLGILLFFSLVGPLPFLNKQSEPQKTPNLKITPTTTTPSPMPTRQIEIETDGPSTSLSTASKMSPHSDPNGVVTYNPSKAIETFTTFDAIQETMSSGFIEPFGGTPLSNPLPGEIVEPTSFSSLPESVIGGDGRSLIADPSIYPWRSICKLYMTWPDAARGVGSGWITDDFHVLTAGHCVYSHSHGGWASTITVIPGMDDFYAPYCHAKGSNYWTSSTWTGTPGGDHQYDWGFIRLDRNIGATTGWLGRAYYPTGDSHYTGTVRGAGYPHDRDIGRNMYYDADSGDYATTQNHWYYIDTGGGQSGMPIYYQDPGPAYYALTIHAYGVYGSYTTNHGTRLGGYLASGSTTRIYDWVNEMISTNEPPNRPADQADLVDRGQRWSLEWDAVDSNYANRYGTFSPTYVSPGITPFSVSCHVSNWGTVSSGSFDVSFYASTNTVISPADFLIGTVSVSSISPYGSRTVTWSGTFPGGLSSGTYYIGWIIDSNSVVAELDEGNNVGCFTSFQLQTDTTAPSNPSSYTANPAVNVWTNDNTIYVSWSGASDGAGSGIYGYGLFWAHSPGFPAATVDTINSYTTSSPLADGIWYLSIRTVDNAGNWNSGYYTVGPFRIDTVAPTNPISFVSTPLVNVWTNDNTIYVEWSESSDGSGSGVDGYGLFWSTNPTGTPATIIDTTDNFTTSSALADGNSWYLHIITADLVGNWNMTVYHIGPFLIDTGPPTTGSILAGTLGTNNWYFTLVNITLSRSDTWSGVLSTMYNVNGSGWQTYTSKFNVTDDGIYTIEWYSEDNAGNIESTNSIQVKIDKVVPNTSINAEGTSTGGWFSTNVNITLNAIDATSGLHNTSYRIEGGSWQLFTGYFLITTEGEYTIEFYSIDLAGHVEATDSFVIYVDKSGPTWDQAPTDQIVPGGVPFRYDLNASDTLSGISSWSINDTTHFSINSQGVLTSIESLPAGIYGLEVTVTDVAGNSLSATFQVDLQPTLPGIPGFPFAAIVLGAAAALGIGIISRRRRLLRKP